MRRLLRVAMGAAAAMLWALPAWAGPLVGKASVDTAQALLGRPVVLTVSLGGDLSSLRSEPAFQWPDGLHLSEERQVSELALKGGGVNRTVNFVYVFVPTKPGTFTIGPFSVARPDGSVTIEPVQITVTKPRLPPFLVPAPRYTL